MEYIQKGPEWVQMYCVGMFHRKVAIYQSHGYHCYVALWHTYHIYVLLDCKTGQGSSTKFRRNYQRIQNLRLHFSKLVNTKRG